MPFQLRRQVQPSGFNDRIRFLWPRRDALATAHRIAGVGALKRATAVAGPGRHLEHSSKIHLAEQCRLIPDASPAG